MNIAKIRVRQGFAVAAVVLAAWLALPAQAADEKDALRKQALALNDVTGKDPMKGKILALLADAPGTKKLLAVALEMAKEKEQPFNYNAAYILASTARLSKDLDASEAFYRLCAELALKLQSGTKLSEAYSGLIDLYYENKKYAESEKVCREFLEIDGDDQVARLKGIVLRRMIQALVKQDKIDEANKVVDRLLKMQPDNWLTLELKGWVQREAGKYDEAVKTYEDVLARINKDEALEKDDKAEFSKEIRYILSGVYVDMNQIDKAAEHLKALLAAEPDNPTYNNDLGYIWADHNMNLEESEKLIRKALEEDRKLRKQENPDLKPEEDKDNGAYLDSLGWVLYKQKKYKEAKKYLQQALEDKDAQHVEIYDHLGDICQALGEKDEAIAAWKKGIEVAGATKREQQKKAEVEKKLKAKE